MNHPPYVCALMYLIEVQWQRVVEQPSIVEAHLTGRQPGDVVPCTYVAVWHHERFTRDDIDNAEVQRGFRSMQVSLCRHYFKTDDVALQLHRGQVRVSVPNANREPFFAGFAPDLITAATWVATGRGPLLVPWETPCPT